LEIFEVTPDANNINPLVAFRSRDEEKQQKKSMKNDAESLNRMIEMKEELIKIKNILEMIKKREDLKFEYLKMTKECLNIDKKNYVKLFLNLEKKYSFKTKWIE
jgi:hypothetical protein